jgi:hypothetical protein
LVLGAAVGAAVVGGLALTRRGGEREETGYPPFDTLKSFGEGVWIVDGQPIGSNGLLLPIRMTVVRLGSGDLLLHSPIGYSPGLARALEGLGTVRHLVAPNLAHWLFLPEWQRAYPEATMWAAPGLAGRPQVERSGLRIDRMLGADAPEAWRDEITQGILPGRRFDEVWFFHRPSRTLIFTDVLQNLEPRKLPPVMRALMRAAASTRGTTPVYLRGIFWAKAGAARVAARALKALEPERIVLAHGTPITADATRRLREGLGWLA